MPEKSRTDRVLLLMMAAVMVCAALLSAGLWTRRGELLKKADTLDEQLAASQAAWQGINEEKLVLQEELKGVKLDIREAETVITESEGKIAQIDLQLATLSDLDAGYRLRIAGAEASAAPYAASSARMDAAASRLVAVGGALRAAVDAGDAGEAAVQYGLMQDALAEAADARAEADALLSPAE